MDAIGRSGSGIVWRPDDAVVERAQLTRFLNFCGLSDFEELYQYSIENVAGFTEQVLGFLCLHFDRPYRQILDLSGGIEWPRWCVGGGMNITRSCLDRYRSTPTASSPAVVWEGEEGVRRVLTYAQLDDEVGRCAAGLRALGLSRGDAIGIHLPMIPETVIALLAIGRIGGIAVPLFSGYGPAAIESRLRDVGARALFTCDGFPRRGARVSAKAVADEAIHRCPEVRLVIVVNRMGGRSPSHAEGELSWEDLISEGKRAGAGMREAEPTAAEDPLLVLYTSGTTGRPKGILHTHCGFPVKAAQDMCFGTDVGPGDRIAWITDIGWMMGPWLIYGALLLGGTIMLYDGAPDYPKPDRIWDFCDKNGVEILGISPTLVRSLALYGDSLPAAHDLSRLRMVGSTGEPWNPDPWNWLFKRVGAGRIPIINYSGGTEISGGILMGNPLLPLKPCSFAAPCPGIAADIFDEQGRSVRGAVGELVIRKPWIGMARGFWKDRERYLKTYWSRWPGIWVHGDWAQRDGDGQWYILGRSDDTLKIGGKRVGPAEVESVLVSHPGVAEAAVIGVPDEVKGTAMIAFCVPSPEAKWKADLAEEVARLVAAELGKPLRPERVYFVAALPRTRNAKVMRRVVRAAYLLEDPGDVTALENPAALEDIRRCANLGDRKV